MKEKATKFEALQAKYLNLEEVDTVAWLQLYGDFTSLQILCSVQIVHWE